MSDPCAARCRCHWHHFQPCQSLTFERTSTEHHLCNARRHTDCQSTPPPDVVNAKDVTATQIPVGSAACFSDTVAAAYVGFDATTTGTCRWVCHRVTSPPASTNTELENRTMESLGANQSNGTAIQLTLPANPDKFMVPTTVTAGIGNVVRHTTTLPGYGCNQTANQSPWSLPIII